jgi:S-adenosylmethionine synthetase
MTLEAAAGKNPFSHVGKLYNVAAHRLAEALVESVPDISRAECYLVSQIGRRVDEPQIVDVRVGLQPTAALSDVRGRIEEIVRDAIARIGSLTQEILRGTIRLF